MGWLTAGVVAGNLFLWTGCASAPSPAPVATLAVRNLTDYEWQLSIAPEAGGEAMVTKLAARQTVPLVLAGGDYVIKQTVVRNEGGAPLDRDLLVRLEAGQTYDWPLVTLLSEVDDPVASGFVP